jgi:hypothetical protein
LTKFGGIIKTNEVSMSIRRKILMSDAPFEDKGYDRCHTQTRGGMHAYARGEMPISYWSKDILLHRIRETLEEASISKEFAGRYKCFLQYEGLNLNEIMVQLKKTKADILRKRLLECNGTHYTGNYYRYTKFYKVVPPSILMYRLRNYILKRKEVKQLKLNIGVV